MIDLSVVLHLINRVLETAPLLPFVVLWNRRRYIPEKFQFLCYYVYSETFYYVLDLISRCVFKNNVYIFHLSTITAVMFISNTYCKIFYADQVKRIIYTSICVFIFISFLDAFLINGLFTNLNSYAQAFGGLFLVALALFHIIQISRANLELINQPDFFMSIAVLVYFSYTIITYVASNMIYNSGYELATTIRLDRIISAPDAFLYALHMGLLTWMFSFFPLNVNPLRALPRWLHYSRWHQRPYKVLGRSSIALYHLTVT